MWVDRETGNIIAFLLITGAIAVVTVPIGLIAWLLYAIFT
jgi:hypothetical protein